jgi:hypothetical protein
MDSGRTGSMVLSDVPVSASRAPLQRHLRRASLVAVGVLAGAVIAACGGGGSSSSSTAGQLLSQTFSANISKIHSGDLALTIDAQLKGLTTLHGQPVELQLSGPFSESAGHGTEFDFSATATVEGSTIPLAVLSTGTALYLEFGGTYYSLPASVNSALGKSAQSQGSSSGSANVLSRLGIDPLSWLTSPKIVGTTMVGGVSAEHLTAQVDVSKLLSDVGKIASHASGIAGQQAASELSNANLQQVASAINSAQVDIYSGASDHILREFRLAVAFTFPGADQKTLSGLTGGSLTIDTTISNLNAAETIKPPSSSQPFSDLLGSGGLGSL